MFENWSFRVKPVKEKPSAVVGSEPTDHNKVIRSLVEGSIKVVVAYMGADTLRKIIVHTVATKIQ